MKWKLLYFCLFGIFLIGLPKLFGKIGSWHSEKILKEHYEFFKDSEIKVSALHYFRGDFLVEKKPNLKWTFNRITGELIPWGSSEREVENKKKGKP